VPTLPLMVVANEAWHMAVAPPLVPAQLQKNGPEPVTDDAVPAEQRLPVGALCRVIPFDVPQTPLMAVVPELVVVVVVDAVPTVKVTTFWA